MARPTEYVRVQPFRDWLNERYDRYEQEFAGVGNKHVLGPLIRLCQDIGWGTAAGQRRLYRYRRGLSDTKRGGRASKAITVAAVGFSRQVVEDALAHAGVDFYELYPEYAHERYGPPEPEAWCPNCADHVLVVEKTWKTKKGVPKSQMVCVWCDWRMTEGHLNGLERAA